MGRTFILLSLACGLTSACAAANTRPSDTGHSDGDDDPPHGSSDDAEAEDPSDDVDDGYGTDDAGSCASESREATAQPLDLFALLDQSGSMTENQDRWTPVTSALRSFVALDSLSGVGMGLTYFPRGAQVERDPLICMPANYSTPDVAIADLPANAAAISASLDAHMFTEANAHDPEHWGTPTRPAVEGVLEYLIQFGKAHPERRPVLLLATDGTPSKACADNAFSVIAERLRAAAMLADPITTYVIGIGEIENLDLLAQAGGSDKPAFIVDASGGANTEQQFLAALEEIRTESLPCEYAIPELEGHGTGIDFGKVNVHLQAGAGEPETVPRVPGATDCSDIPAWYYDNPKQPTQVHLCPSSCERTRETGSKLRIVYGCKTAVVVL
jgi:hypothetical protein